MKTLYIYGLKYAPDAVRSECESLGCRDLPFLGGPTIHAVYPPGHPRAGYADLTKPTTDQISGLIKLWRKKGRLTPSDPVMVDREGLFWTLPETTIRRTLYYDNKKLRKHRGGFGYYPTNSFAHTLRICQYAPDTRLAFVSTYGKYHRDTGIGHPSFTELLDLRLSNIADVARTGLEVLPVMHTHFILGTKGRPPIEWTDAQLSEWCRQIQPRILWPGPDLRIIHAIRDTSRGAITINPSPP